jgi:hypothetical protein
MNKLAMIVVVILMAGSALVHLTASPQEETWVVVQAGGKERAAFVPAVKPYTEGGPAVSVYLEKRNIRTKEGLVVTGFEFIGWKEASTNRVLVFALVPREDAPNAYMPDGDEKNLRPQDFATLTVKDGQSLPIEEMKALGIEPMVLRAAPRKANQQ